MWVHSLKPTDWQRKIFRRIAQRSKLKTKKTEHGISTQIRYDLPQILEIFSEAETDVLDYSKNQTKKTNQNKRTKKAG